MIRSQATAAVELELQASLHVSQVWNETIYIQSHDVLKLGRRPLASISKKYGYENNYSHAYGICSRFITICDLERLPLYKLETRM